MPRKLHCFRNLFPCPATTSICTSCQSSIVSLWLTTSVRTLCFLHRCRLLLVVECHCKTSCLLGNNMIVPHCVNFVGAENLFLFRCHWRYSTWLPLHWNTRSALAMHTKDDLQHRCCLICLGNPIHRHSPVRARNERSWSRAFRTWIIEACVRQDGALQELAHKGSGTFENDVHQIVS